MMPRLPKLAVSLCLGSLLVLLLFSVVAGGEDGPASSPQVPVLVELTASPAAQVYAGLRTRTSQAQAVAAVQAQIRQIDQAQQALIRSAPLADAQVIFRTQRVYNGLALLVSKERIREIEALSGVAAVHALPVYTVNVARTTPYLAAPELWDAVYGEGFDGDAVSIGIIDTGIDYFHRDFGGPGNGFRENDPAVITDHVAGIQFPTAKVVGGYDFVGDNYDGQVDGNPIPRPDPDPADCWGHGTHVAGIAAGGGVLVDGRVAYTGPYTSGLDFSRFLIGPGVAPRAKLYALKIFGCTGVSNLVPLALEWAVDPNRDGDFADHLDIVNLSVGSAYGAPDDPTAVATNNAALAGVIVVAAAGNDGDVNYIVSSPGTADRGISVAASAITGLPFPGEERQQPTTDAVPAFSARGPRRGDSALKPDISAPGVSIRSAAKGTGFLAVSQSGTSMATPQVAGAAALLRQLHPGWTVEEVKALLMNTARYNLAADSASPPLIYSPARVGAGRMDLSPTRQASVIAYNATDPGQVSISFGTPRVIGDLNLLKNLRIVNKGEVTQTLFLTYSPVVDMPGAEIRMLGDSMVRLSPYGVQDIPVVLAAQSDRLANIADPTVSKRLNFPRHWVNEESGYIYLWPQRLGLQAQLTGAKMLPAVDIEVRGQMDGILTPQSGELSYTVTLESRVPLTVTGAGVHVGPANGTGPEAYTLISREIPDVQILTVTGALTLSQAAMNLLAADSLYVQVATSDHPDGAIRGQIEAQEAVLRVPIYAAPAPAAAMGADQASLNFGTAITGSQSLTLVGQGVLSAASLAESHFPTDTVSVLSAAELVYSSLNEEESVPSLDHADLQYVAVTSDYMAQKEVERTRLIFALATYGEWSSPNEMQFRIHLDVDEDGAADFVLRSDNVGQFLRTGTTDEFFSVLENVTTGEKRLAYFRNLVSSAELNTAVFQNNVVLLAVDARDIGLTEEDSGFRFWVSTTSIDTEVEESTVDTTPVIPYDIRKPGVWTAGGLSGFPLFYDLAETQLHVQVNRDAYFANGSQGLLLLHHHNEKRDRTQIIDIQWQWLNFLPIVGASDGATQPPSSGE